MDELIHDEMCTSVQVEIAMEIDTLGKNWTHEGALSFLTNFSTKWRKYEVFYILIPTTM